ncbi:MAG: T9SS type A sorting domain-containing protein [Candidatus Kapabacteria bacterium]|jgi:photosystem II stability/assembly factor-like uncharacterized protein|nr:T9SS type A sorting domain-containing protein [Candidatus Kapabacteria bacterium]
MKKSIIVLILLAYQFSYTQWELLYPTAPNTTITSFAVSGNNVFAGSSERGVFLSTDKGHTWTNKRSGKDIKPVKVNSLVISGNYVFAATADSGMYRSSNLGDSWEKINNGLFMLEVNSVAVSGSNIYAGTNGAGVFFSSDNGENWTLRNNGISNFKINIIKTDGENIFIGTNGGGIYYTSDKGENWTPKNSGLENIADSTIFSIDIDGKNVIAGTGNGVFLSTDSGGNWVRKNTYSEAVVVAFNGNKIYVSYQNGTSFQISTDMGNTWKKKFDIGLSINYFQHNSSTKYINSFKTKSLAFIDENIILAGTELHGICLSTNGGEFFETINLFDLNLSSIVISGENIFAASFRSHFYQNYGGGIYRSTNSGNSWRATGFQSQTIWSMAMKQDTLFALHYYDGIFFSTDLGSTWQVKDSLSEYSSFRTLVIDGNKWVIATVSSGVLISTDSGNSWESKNVGFETGIYSVALNGGNIFVGTGGTKGGKGVYLSTDLGESFVQKGLDGFHIYDIKVSGNYVFAGTNNGFYRSTDYGETWELSFRDTLATSTFSIELYEGNLIIGVSGPISENQLLVSKDMGESWTRKDETSEGSDTPFRYIGNAVKDFAVNGEYIYAVVEPGMIFKAKLNDLLLTSVEDESDNKNGIMIFPNPSNDFITIQLNNKGLQPFAAEDKVQIFNMLGIEVMSVGTELDQSQQRIDVSHLPAGVYFIRVGTRVEKFVKM